MLAVNLDTSAAHAAEMERRFRLHAPEQWRVQSIIGFSVDEAIALGADLILWPRPFLWPQYAAWETCRAAGVPVIGAHGSNVAGFVSDPPRLFWPIVVGGEVPGDGDTERSYGPGLELDIRCADGRTEQSWAVAEAAGVYAGLLDYYGNPFDARAALRSLATPEADPNAAAYGTIDLTLPLGPHHADPQPPVDVRVEEGVLRFLPWQGARYQSNVVTGVMGFTPVSYVVGPRAPGEDASVDIAAEFGYDDHVLSMRTLYQDGSLSAPVTIEHDTGNPPVVQPVAAPRAGRSTIVVTAVPSPGCQVAYRVRTGEGEDWMETAASGDDLNVATRRAAEVQARQVDVDSTRASEWSASLLVPGLPDASFATPLLP